MLHSCENPQMTRSPTLAACVLCEFLKASRENRYTHHAFRHDLHLLPLSLKLQTVPLSRDSFDRMICLMRLPKSLPQAINEYSYPQFSRFTTTSSCDDHEPTGGCVCESSPTTSFRRGVSYLLKVNADPHPPWICAISHDPTTKFNWAYLSGLSSDTASGWRLDPLLKSTASWSTSAMHIPTLIAQLRLERLEHQLHSCASRIDNLEMSTGHYRRQDAPESQVDLVEMDFVFLTRQASSQSLHVGVCEAQAKQLVEMTKKAGEFHLSLKREAGEAVDGDRLAESLEHMHSQAKHMLFTIAQLNHRIQVQLSVVSAQ